MKPKIALGICFALSTAALAAQSAPPQRPNLPTPPLSALLRMLPAVGSCPVQMEAQHTSAFHMEQAGGSRQKSGPGMRLKLILTNPKADPVVKARVTVRGLNGAWQMLPAGDAATARPSPSADLERTVEAAFTAGPNGSSFAELDLPGFSAVQSIRLVAVTYASGTTWKGAGPDACTVAPDPLMLVAAH
ncbi:MAG TPA: hypothetical protein VMV57_00775 [Terracidiphilus sp.]|nr:hypothetical protein [Terracidiphilus sp.]